MAEQGMPPTVATNSAPHAFLLSLSATDAEPHSPTTQLPDDAKLEPPVPGQETTAAVDEVQWPLEFRVEFQSLSVPDLIDSM